MRTTRGRHGRPYETLSFMFIFNVVRIFRIPYNGLPLCFRIKALFDDGYACPPVWNGFNFRVLPKNEIFSTLKETQNTGKQHIETIKSI
jgi:hypothetical protein